MKRIELTIYGEPVSKGRPRMTRTGQTYTPAKTHAAERKIAAAYQDVYGDYQFPKDVPLELKARFYMKIPTGVSHKKREELDGSYCKKHIDTDNLLKLVSDGLNGVCYPDDSQIVKLSAEKRWSTEPRTEIEVIDITE